ncbi:MAG: TolC family protein [Candidatus Omnitrophota bacterium]
MQKMVIRLFLVALCASFVSPHFSLANESQEEAIEVDLKKAISMALDASENYKIEANKVRRNQEEYRKERSRALPQVAGKASWSNNFQYPDTTAAASVGDYNLDTGITVNQKVFTFRKVSSAIKAAKKAIEVSRYGKETLKQKVIYDTKLAYYSSCLAKRRLEIAKQSYKNAKQNEEILRSYSAAGRASKYDNIKISADIASRKPIINNAYTEYYSAMETLKVVIGVNSEAKIRLSQKFPDKYPRFKKDKVALSLYRNQPAIKALAKSIEKGEYLIDAKKAAFYPEVSLFSTWNHKGSSNDFEVGGDYLKDYGVAGLKVKVPIWTSGKTAAELSQARIDKENAELKYKKGKKDYLLELDKALSQYRGYLKTLKSNKEAVRLAKEAFDLSQQMLEVGKISLTDLNDSELKLTNEKINKEVTLFNINTTLAKIERLTLIGEQNDK